MKLIVDTCVFIDAFDEQSENHAISIKLLEHLAINNELISMPAQGWFEVQCTLQRLINEKKFKGPVIDGRMNYQVELIHIDKEFILKYSMMDIPYIKAGDHIFIVIAKKNGLPLVTSDNKMIQICNENKVQVYTPDEYLKKN